MTDATTPQLSTALSFPFTLKGIAMNWPPDWDTIATYWLLLRFGGEKLPPAPDFTLHFWDGHRPPDGRSAQEWLQEGVLAIDCGGEGSPLDHHPHEQFPNQCAFTRALELLGLTDEPQFAELASFTLWDDTRGRIVGAKRPNKEAGPFTVARAVKEIAADFRSAGTPDAEEAYTGHIQEVFEWAFRFLDAHMGRQRRFFGPAMDALGKAQVEEVRAGSTSFTLVDGESDCEEFGVVARSRRGAGAHVVIQRRPTGHFQITAASCCLLNMDGLVARLRRRELEYRSARGDSSSAAVDPVRLRAGGTIEEVPNLHYFRPAGGTSGNAMILNGSRVEHAVEPTAIPPEVLHQTVVEWLRSGEASTLAVETTEAALRHAVRRTVTAYGRAFLVTAACTAAENFPLAALKEGAAVAIRTRPDGSWVVMVSWRAHLLTNRLAADLRMEAERRSPSGRRSGNSRQLEYEGIIDAVPEVEYRRGADAASGRPRAALVVSPPIGSKQRATPLSVERLIEITQTWLERPETHAAARLRHHRQPSRMPQGRPEHRQQRDDRPRSLTLGQPKRGAPGLKGGLGGGKR